MRALLVGLLLALRVPAQEEKKDDVQRLAGDVAAALQKTAQRGSFSLSGNLKTEVNPDDADEEPTLCAISGSVAPGSRAVLEVRSDSSTHELVLKAGKLAGRETWKGHPLDLLNAPSELLSLLDFERLAITAKEAASAKALADEKVAAEDCAVTELLLPKGAIRSYHNDAEAAEEEEKSVRDVLLKLLVRKADGLVVRMEVSVRRLYKDDRHPNDSTKGLSSFTLSLRDFGKADVAVPRGLEKLLKD
jgi:hypothetical protein